MRNSELAETGAASMVPVAGEERFVMVLPPTMSYAGHVGDEVVVTDRNESSVYVVFESGIRECYSPGQFSALFCRSARGAATSPGPADR